MTQPSQLVFSSRAAQRIEEVINRILEIIQPQKILLFGSAARAELTADSDLDILVILSGPAHRRRVAQSIYRNLHGIDTPVDIVVATEQDIQQYRDQPGGVLRHALREGQVIYDAG